MTTQYIDLNCSNASSVNSKENNSWTTQFNEGMELPTGTKVSVQSSFINKKGITGSSIEIEEEIREKVLFNYYAVDSDYFTLIQEPQNPENVHNYDLYTRYSYHINDRYAYLDDQTGVYAKPDNTGRSENRMPLMNFINSNENADVQLMPMIGQIELVIPKGTYSVSSLSDLITDQLQGLNLPNESNTTFIDYQKANGKYKGILSSFTMNRIVQAEEPWLNAIPGPPIQPNPIGGQWKNFWEAFNEFNNAVPAPWTTKFFTEQLKVRADTHIDGIYPNGYDQYPGNYTEPLDYRDTTIYSTLAITAERYEDIRQYWFQAPQGGNYGPSTPIQPSINWIRTSNIGSLINIAGTENQYSDYCMGFSAIRNGGSQSYALLNPVNFNDVPPSGFVERDAVGDVARLKALDDLGSCSQMNYFDRGIIMGSDSPTVIYNASKSGFAIDRLHQPTKFPTNDKYGNEFNDRAGQEGFYIKRVPSGNFALIPTEQMYDFSVAQAPINTPAGYMADDLYQKSLNTLNTIMDRTSGVQIINWAYNTARNNRTLSYENGDINNDWTDPFRRYDEFFRNKAEAEEAWKQTIWARLGFSYDQLQNPSRWGRQRYNEKPDVANVGFTTETDADASVITTISTLFNSFDSTAGKAADDTGIPLPKLDAGIQLFTQLDVNVPYSQFNNNTTINDGKVVVAPYQGSYYQNAVMIPVISKTRQVIADQLPTLSKFGYFIVSSDIVAQTDIASKREPLSILDVIPVSSLSNQDFIADRNEMIHSISNPKVVNSITVKILNPDLTVPNLEPFSSIVLKIDKPIPTPTEIQQQVLDNQSTQLIEQQVVAQEKAEERTEVKSEKVNRKKPADKKTKK